MRSIERRLSKLEGQKLELTELPLIWLIQVVGVDDKDKSPNVWRMNGPEGAMTFVSAEAAESYCEDLYRKGIAQTFTIVAEHERDLDFCI
jgi:hypothetical protein